MEELEEGLSILGVAEEGWDLKMTKELGRQGWMSIYHVNVQHPIAQKSIADMHWVEPGEEA